jgi:hypothetical protein
MDIDSKLSQEYVALRSEILTWIAVQYTLIAITVSVTGISLSVFKVEAHWIMFSSVLIVIISCLGFLTAHAHSKITLAGAYISVFHAERTIWDHLIYSKIKSKWTIATTGFFPTMLLLYASLYTIIILYPSSIYEKPLLLEEYYPLILPTIIFSLMLIILWNSGRREPYIKLWRKHA